MKIRTVAIFLLSCLLAPILGIPISAQETQIETDAKSVIVMEANTLTVLYEDNADEPLPPASVTKIMTLLLVMEAVDSGKIKLTDQVTVSDLAASMGGSQIYLEVGEQMSVEEMIKSVLVASANDAALALAEFVAGSEEAFVAAMNKRAEELGMVNTHFENTNGLDDTVENHVTTARDIALMSAELLKHKTILNYTTIWQDTVRNGQFTLTNTNRLIRFYAGCNGLKTGSTSKAGFCISATAERDGMQLIAVVMGSSTRDTRNATAKKLLDYGFAGYSYFGVDTTILDPIAVKAGTADTVSIGYPAFRKVLGKGEAEKVQVLYEIPSSLSAPISRGDTVGKVVYVLGDQTVGEENIYALEDVPRITFGQYLGRLLKKYLLIS
ncbi:MAG: D-alanyl-D-alanine carboxypeptidase family protein [Eubacteriales bacterium]